MSQLEFYRSRAAEAKRDAESATLDNVRQRCLRSEAAWADMAARAERGDKMRAKLDAEKAAALAASPPRAVLTESRPVPAEAAEAF